MREGKPRPAIPSTTGNKAPGQRGPGQRGPGLIKRSFSLAGHRTSVALEEEFWSALMSLAQRRNLSLSALVAEVDTARDPARPLASALRVTALANAWSG